MIEIVEVNSLTIEMAGFRYKATVSRLYYNGRLVKEWCSVEETIILGYSP